ncbi:Uncharacterised protein [[Clostridium] sordellii]|uniref:hypothetical protein n=1 Tax=Paraclostridium sordellii TaxID=1505 RepID=UPI0005DBE3D4|nr:hypothetical protein [Paeniclostridium sordellii]CEN29789.1 Uncharacterised protein [[Clostridium] sordellii] [Paeniclostridium sordellii]CEN30345.1 Uncharacterised protein [[Clostridium] sordellii] [Paeniclostridium sordellii]CEQ19647.1 Uncharacterised protein [[Clostridium] sordellii] [Paeniclostridium sordellii]
MQLLNSLGSFILAVLIIFLVYKFACKHESYEIELSWSIKPIKISGKLKKDYNENK